MTPGLTCSLWYKGKSYDSGSYRVLACNAIDPPDEIPNDPAGTVYRNDAEWTGWTLTNCALSASGGNACVSANAVDPYISLWLGPNIGGKNLVFRVRKIASSQWSGEGYVFDAGWAHIKSFQELDATFPARFSALPVGEWAVFSLPLPTDYADYGGVRFDLGQSANTVFDLSDLYIGTGAYLPLKHLSVATKAHLCIHPTTKQLGFFQNSIFTPFSTDTVIEDDKVYHIVLSMSGGIASLKLNGKTIATNVSMFSETAYPITKLGNYYPTEMSFKGGLAPSTSLAPSPNLAPSNTILSNTTHANGWIDDVRIYDRLLTESEIESIVYHTLLTEEVTN